jgi:S-DNA-T family DNA segregation ATPase FtsK/SpoIIIE
LRPNSVAYSLLFSGLLLALAVFSYDPVDPPSSTVYPLATVPHNLLGLPGAFVARRLSEFLGITVYLLLASWFVLVLLLMLRRGMLTWLRRLLGWLLLIPVSCVAADALVPSSLDGFPAGAGGTLGTLLLESLQPLPLVLRALAVAAVSAVSAMFITDFAILRWARWPWRAARWLYRRLAALRPSRQAIRPERPRGQPTDSDQETELQDASEEEQDEDEQDDTSAVDGDIPIHHATGMTVPAAAAAEVPVALSQNRPPVPAEEDPFADYELPPLTLLEEPQPFPYEEHDQRLRDCAALLEKTFADFGLKVRVVGINTGPVITQYEVALETGLRVHKVTAMADDLALNLKVPSVRMVAPIPGKNTVGIEIPNEHRAVVRLKEVILASAKKIARQKIPLFVGKDTEGRPLVYDLAEMPHLLIAGRTGTGKSVCMNALILTMLMTRRPDEVRMIMIDPKMLELSEYGRIPHLMHPVVKDMKKAEAILAWAVDKMEERYDILSRARVRSIAGYNELDPDEIYRRLDVADDEERARIPPRMPYIVIFVDEMNDLMMTMKKEVEGHIIRLAQKSRAAGIHLVVATQKPTVDVITGLIKSNLPARICFQVSSRSDSRVVLDEMGADKLLGKGDMLFLQPGTSTLVRAQGTYAADEEITRVVERLECDPCYAQELIQLSSSGSKEGKGSLMEQLRARDDLYEQAIEVIIREGRGSVSLLQRALGIGYGRAARLVDFMAEDGIVGDYNGSQAREVLYTPEQWQQMKESGQPVA